MYMTYKHYLGRVLSVERSKLECLGIRVLKFEVFFWTDEHLLKRAPSERAQVASGHSSLERAVSKALSEQECCFWIEFAWASYKRAPSERPQNATETWSLKRTRLRLSEQHPVQPHLIFRFVYLGANPNFLNCSFWLVWSLLMYLILLKHHLYGIGLSFINRSNVWKNVQEHKFFRNLVFSSEWCRIKYVCCLYD